jgi:hypothetical protein
VCSRSKEDKLWDVSVSYGCNTCVQEVKRINCGMCLCHTVITRVFN